MKDMGQKSFSIFFTFLISSIPFGNFLPGEHRSAAVVASFHISWRTDFNGREVVEQEDNVSHRYSMLPTNSFCGCKKLVHMFNTLSVVKHPIFYLIF